MDFQLTDEQLQLQSMVRDFATREIAPHVHEWDEKSQFPLDTVKHLGKLGLMGCIFPAEYGGILHARAIGQTEPDEFRIMP